MVRLTAFLLSCACPCAVSAQPWLDAYRAGDYQTAADLLHPIVTDPDLQVTATDAEPARHLAMLYAEGLGVSPQGIPVSVRGASVSPRSGDRSLRAL